MIDKEVIRSWNKRLCSALLWVLVFPIAVAITLLILGYPVLKMAPVILVDAMVLAGLVFFRYFYIRLLLKLHDNYPEKFSLPVLDESPPQWSNEKKAKWRKVSSVLIVAGFCIVVIWVQVKSN